MATKMFDLHIEMGTTSLGAVYALTILGNNALKIQGIGTDADEALKNFLNEMVSTGALSMVANHPQLSQYPMGNVAQSSVQQKPTPNSAPPSIKKESAHYLGNVPHPTCQARCLTYENFGVSKCGSFCKGKKGV